MKRLSVISILCVLSGLLSCSKGPTALKIVLSLGTLQVDQVSVTGRIDENIVFSDKRFPTTPKLIESGADIVVLFSDANGGKEVALELRGYLQSKQVARTTARAVLRRGEMVQIVANLGVPTDGGADILWDGNCSITPLSCRNGSLFSCVGTEAAVEQEETSF